MRLVTAVPIVPLMFFFATRKTNGYLNVKVATMHFIFVTA